MTAETGPSQRIVEIARRAFDPGSLAVIVLHRQPAGRHRLGRRRSASRASSPSTSRSSSSSASIYNLLQATTLRRHQARPVLELGAVAARDVGGGAGTRSMWRWFHSSASTCSSIAADRRLHDVARWLQRLEDAADRGRRAGRRLHRVRALLPDRRCRRARSNTGSGCSWLWQKTAHARHRSTKSNEAFRGGSEMEEIANLMHGFATVLEPFNIGVHDHRHPARRDHRRAARSRRRQRRRDPAAAHLLHVADLGDHHAVLHLLGRAVRRRHHLGAVQHPGRAMVGGDHLRRPSDGAAGQGRRGADRRLHVVLRRRAVRGHRHHAGGAAGRALRAAIRAGREIRRLFPGVLQLRRPEQGTAVQDASPP